MMTGRTRPAISSGIPKMRPMVIPWPSVRLITRPAMKSTRPMPTLKEKL